MKISKSILMMLTLCLTMTAYAGGNRKPSSDKEIAAASPVHPPTMGEEQPLIDPEAFNKEPDVATPPPAEQAAAEIQGPMTVPRHRNDKESEQPADKQNLLLQQNDERLKALAQFHEAKKIAIDIQFRMPGMCDVRQLRMGKAAERIAANSIDAVSKNPGKSLLQVAMMNQGTVGDSHVLQYHKTKCMEEFLSKRLGEDFKLKRLTDKTDLQAQAVLNGLTRLRDHLEKRTLNLPKERCESPSLSEKMACVSRIMVPTIESHMMQSTIDTLIATSKSEMTLGEAKDAHLESLRGMIRHARTTESVLPRGVDPTAARSNLVQ